MLNTQEEAKNFLRKHAMEIAGTLCVFGDWFGKPMDNVHRVISYETRENYLKFVFDGDETLEVWNAQGFRKENRNFIIQNAQRVRWEWFYYGRAKLPENRFFVEHVVKHGVVAASSNVTWYSPDFKPSVLKPAVSLNLC
jgi:hypothetical protein